MIYPNLDDNDPKDAYLKQIVEELRGKEIPIYCFGLTQDGPLKDLPIVWFDGSDDKAGFEAFKIARECGYAVRAMRREWRFRYPEAEPVYPIWALVFYYPAEYPHK